VCNVVIAIAQAIAAAACLMQERGGQGDPLLGNVFYNINTENQQ